VALPRLPRTLTGPVDTARIYFPKREIRVAFPKVTSSPDGGAELLTPKDMCAGPRFWSDSADDSQPVLVRLVRESKPWYCRSAGSVLGEVALLNAAC
jgi:hypothetical protein